jgi:(1->4)-alpha-D-glucan 1-alpha-D-glucosylmutase
LVDPDNRRPVDFGARATALEAALVEWRRDPAGTVGRTWQNWPTGEIKLLTIAVLLEHRREHAALYESVAYRPIECGGAFAGFVRECDSLALAVIFSRYPLSDTADTVAPPDSGSWRNVLTHESVFATGHEPWALQDLPFLVLERAI